MTQPAAIADFKLEFDRDFPFGVGKESVRDTDITKAFNQADMVFNAGLWSNTTEKKIAYLYASAHMLVLGLQAAGGLTTGKGKGADSHGGGNISSKSVGQVSVTYQLPENLANSSILNQFMRTDYGQKYLAMLTPRLVGNTYTVPGWREC